MPRFTSLGHHHLIVLKDDRKTALLGADASLILRGLRTLLLKACESVSYIQHNPRDAADAGSLQDAFGRMNLHGAPVQLSTGFGGHYSSWPNAQQPQQQPMQQQTLFLPPSMTMVSEAAVATSVQSAHIHSQSTSTQQQASRLMLQHATHSRRPGW